MRGEKLISWYSLIQLPQNRGIKKKTVKSPFYTMINHYMYKDSFKNTTDIDFGRKMDQI